MFYMRVRGPGYKCANVNKSSDVHMSHMFAEPTTPLTDVACGTFLLLILLTDVQKEAVSLSASDFARASARAVSSMA